ncbi:ethanolamine ammonia-lyase small subunit [Caballeronia novacaledonica]|uniref:Ethanolamine ammonia-lyase small subunit n=2 Tax=Caballeronia novacaledonica TaxID=1544861 RepID=A0A2U3I0A6_9BURK|nr:ethanolamine ammonia-lyase subunit EutC [Caballeronia novacaledonica]SPB13529.1 ethanolamine ammonia-lyase small subunit [Caballeronia novacaledonica]
MIKVSANPWEALRQFTDARIALGRAGSSVPTAPLLAFNLAHAQARDAVHRPLDVPALSDELTSKGFESATVCSAASSRDVYLRRPDLGRRLSDESATRLDAHTKHTDLVFVIADGLSSNAASAHAMPLIERTIARLDGWRIGPVVIATQARVALGDCIGSILKARIVAVLIGERPGLSSPASLGVYVTYDPRQGRSDAQRNCISNVRPEGLAYDAAAFKLAYLLNEARARKLTGVGLKDDSAMTLPGRTIDRLSRE